MKLVDRFNPKVDKKIHILIAGILWCGVGVMLVSYAAGWLADYEGKWMAAFCAAGFLASLPVHLLGFKGIAEKNLERLLPLESKKCIFSFITWKSYFIVAVMIAMGITLRHSPVPKQYLSIVYNGIGLGLFLSGNIYIRYFVKLLFIKQKFKTNKHF